MRRIMVMAALLFCYGGLHAQQNDLNKLDGWLADNATIMGGRDILLIYKNGRMIYTHSEDKMTAGQKMWGRIIARRQGKTFDGSPYTPETRQPIASCSKWLSAALVMTFVDEGKLKLADTVGKYLPVLSQHGKGGITIADCLSHLTGIQAPPLREDLQDMKDISSMDGAILQIAAMPMEGQPGKVFHYSNVGLQIAGAVLEKISGKSFEDLFAERIARPLDMAHTDFGNKKVALPAGGAISTPDDYINFLAMILNDGVFKGKRILSEASIKAMQVNRLTPGVKIAYSPAQMTNVGYGFGEWLMDDGAISSPGLFGSFPWVDYKHHYAGFLMTVYLNNQGRDERYEELVQLVNNAVGD